MEETENGVVSSQSDTCCVPCRRSRCKLDIPSDGAVDNIENLSDGASDNENVQIYEMVPKVPQDIEGKIKNALDEFTPNLVFTVIGDSNNFLPKPWNKTKFVEAMKTAAISSKNCWFLYGSCHQTNFTVTSLVKRIMSEILLEESKEVNEDKRKEKCEDPYQIYQSLQTNLGIRISYFLKKSDQRHIPSSGNITKIRACDDEFLTKLLKIEKMIHREQINLSFIQKKMAIPIIIVLVEGGLTAIKHATAAIEEGYPVIIIKGSGKAADLIASHLEGECSLKVATAKLLGRRFVLNSDLFEQLEGLLHKLKEKEWMITVFDIEQQSSSQLSEEIAKILSSYWVPEKYENELSGKSNLDDDVDAEIFSYLYYLEFQKKSIINSPKGSVLFGRVCDSNTMTDLREILFEDDVLLNFIEVSKKEQKFFKELRNDVGKKCSKLVGYSKVTALIASAVLSKKAKEKKESNDKESAQKLTEIARLFEARAAMILDGFEERQSLLLTPADVLGIKTSPLEFAYYTERLDFISHRECVNFMDSIWHSSKKTGRNVITEPRTKFIAHYIFNFIAIACFSIFCLTDIRYISDFSSVSLWQLGFSVWLIGDILEEVLAELFWDKFDKLSEKDLKRNKLSHTIRFRCIWWFSDSWNRFDLASYVLYVVAVLVQMLKPSQTMRTARRLYTCCLVFFYVRFLRVLLMSRILGPLVITIGSMMKDLLRFLFILAIFVVACGVAYHSNLFPNYKNLFTTSWEEWRIWSIISFPYWQIYGENMLDVFEEQRAISCKEIVSTNNTIEDSECAESDWMLPLISAIYMMLSNLLLVNLIIAIFSSRFDRIQENSAKIFTHNRLSVISEYKIKLPSPINLVIRPIQLIKYLTSYKFRKTCYKSKQGDINGGRTDEKEKKMNRKQQILARKTILAGEKV